MDGTAQEKDKENGGQTEISNSIAVDAKQFAPAVRGHWSVENRLHWRLDVVLREDESRIRKGNAPTIMTAIRHLCANLFQKEPSNLSLKKKHLKAAWNDDFREGVCLPKNFNAFAMGGDAEFNLLARNRDTIRGSITKYRNRALEVSPCWGLTVLLLTQT
jgi:hypothetical protein